MDDSCTKHASINIWYTDHSSMHGSCMVHSWHELHSHDMHGSCMSYACTMHVDMHMHETCMFQV